MALAYALLSSLLVDGDQSGYDVVKCFDEQISCYWRATHQQVYKELRELAKKGWVRSETITQTQRPNKTVYSITEQGRAALTAWVEQPSQPTPIREELMAKLKSGFLVPTATLINELKRRQQIHQEGLNALMAMEANEFPLAQTAEAKSMPYEMKLYHLALRRGIRYETEWVEWCQEAITAIAEYDH
jgi:DNA-binding PadR family transcriptional regulator